MPTLTERLHNLGRRVLGQPKLTDPAGWTKAMSRWKLLMGAGLFTAVAAVFNIFVGNRWVAVCLLPSVLTTTFQAGRMLNEYERSLGKRTFGRLVRPPGI